MVVIGVIGGAGSGKTFYCNYLVKKYQVPFIEGDQIARVVLENDAVVKEKILHGFGQQIFNEAGDVIRHRLGQIVFQDKDKLLLLNDIMHPAMYNLIKEQLKTYTSYPFVILEAAVMIEARFIEFVDALIYIKADEALRLDRLIHRRGIDEDRALALINNSRDDYEKYAHEILMSQADEQQSLNNLERMIGKILEDRHEKLT